MARIALLAVPAVALAVGAGGLVALRAVDRQPLRAHYAPLVETVVPVRATPAPTPAPAPAPTPAPTPTPAPVVSVHTMLVGGVTRQWEQLTPGGGTTAQTPILVVLHGQAVTAAQEVDRDAMTPLVADGRAELVYPQGLGTSWNALGCCAYAAAHGIDDAGFIAALVAQVDPGHTRPIDLVGYSNGGRLAYTIACRNPALVDAYAVVGAMPLPGCTLGRPITILQVDGSADPEIAYRPVVTDQMERLRVLDGCAPGPATVQTGSLVTATYAGCGSGTRLALATYQGHDHTWPVGDAATPGAGRTIWAFLSGGQPW